MCKLRALCRVLERVDTNINEVHIYNLWSVRKPNLIRPYTDGQNNKLRSSYALLINGQVNLKENIFAEKLCLVGSYDFHKWEIKKKKKRNLTYRPYP